MLTDEEWAALTAIGHGNGSQGIRELVAKHMDEQPLSMGAAHTRIPA